MDAFGESTDERDGKDTFFAKLDPSAPDHPVSTSDLALQTRRHANLRHLIQLLDAEGIQSWAVQAAVFADMTGPQLQALMEGDTISDWLAREIEWAVHRPNGWLDKQWEDRLDD